MFTLSENQLFKASTAWTLLHCPSRLFVSESDGSYTLPSLISMVCKYGYRYCKPIYTPSFSSVGFSARQIDSGAENGGERDGIGDFRCC